MPEGPSDDKPPVDAAVVTPLLKTAVFGANLGIAGVGCNLGGSLLGTVAAELGISDLLAPVVLEGISACVQMGLNAVAVLEELTQLSRNLSFVNPLIDPLLELLASAVETIGVEYADQLAPFGETIATLAPTVRYLIGGDA